MFNKITSAIAVSTLVLSIGLAPEMAMAGASGQQGKKDHGSMNHSMMNHDQMKPIQPAASTGMNEALPKEPGQGAFATIAEIVAMLANNPATDWSKVDINGLREHLVDMDELVMRTKSVMSQEDNKIVFTISGTGRTLKAIYAMVPAHSAVLTRTTAWNVKAENNDTGAVMTITSNNPAALKVVKALGFYGIMATGAHHQAHHLAMARGEVNAHSHN